MAACGECLTWGGGAGGLHARTQLRTQYIMRERSSGGHPRLRSSATSAEGWPPRPRIPLFDQSFPPAVPPPCPAQQLIWDLFVGRAIWLDSLSRGTPFTWSALTLTNGIGPPGLLLYVLLCISSGRGLPTLGYEPSEDRS